MRRLLRFFVLLAAGLVVCAAQAGPSDVPCSQCPVFRRPPVPESGFWSNPLQPGTGFSLELQHKRVGGTYYGYGADGKAVWYLFSGTLARATPTDAYAWSLDTAAYEFRGGACLGCAPSSGPSPGTAVARLRFEFLQRGLARVRVGDGAWTFIQPFTFGVATHAEFAPEVSYPVPDLDGPWVLVFQDTGENGDASSRRATIIDMTPDTPGDGLISHGLFRVISAADSRGVGLLFCSRGTDRTIVCVYTALPGESRYTNSPVKEFLLPLGNISASRFKGEAADGETVEGFRLDHD